jgi:hypothetical protein
MYINSFQLISAPLIIILGFLPVYIVGAKLKLSFMRIISIYVWHALFTLIYSFYVISNGGDALGYFNAALEVDFSTSLGNLGVILIAAFFRELFDLSFLDISLIFGILGAIGLLFFDVALQSAVLNKKKWLKRLVTLIIFLPSVSFWSAGLGKDPISFLATCLCLWATLNFNKRYRYIIFSIAIMFTVRPHMAGMMVIAFAVATIMLNGANLIKKLFLRGAVAVAIFVMVPFALTYAGLDGEVKMEAMSSYIETRQGYNMEGGGGIDIASMSLPEQLFAYMFRPLVFEVNSVFSAAAALDNLILLFLFVAGGWAMLKGKRSDLGENRVFMWVYALMAWTLLSMTTANLGIALRQKWMFAPILIFLFISVIGRRKQEPSVWQSVNHDVYVSSFHATDRHRQH